MILDRNKRAEDDVGQWQHHIEIIEVSFVMHVMMRIQPTEPGCRFQPASLGNMHAVVEVFIKKIIENECQQAAGEYICSQRPLQPKDDGRVKNDDKRGVPPGEANLAYDFRVGQKILGASSEKTVMNQSVSAEGISPKRFMHQVFVQYPFKETRVSEKT